MLGKPRMTPWHGLLLLLLLLHMDTRMKRPSQGMCCSGWCRGCSQSRLCLSPPRGGVTWVVGAEGVIL